MSLVETLVTALVPILVKEAETLLGLGSKPSGPAWITELVNDVVDLLDKSLPAWIAPSEEAVKGLVEAAVAKLL